MKKILFFLLSIMSCASFTQNIVIYSEGSAQPISGVAVFNSDKSKSTVSDLDGKVSLDNFSDEEKIIFTHVSYLRHVSIKSQIKTHIYLKPSTQDLDEIVISASKFEQNKREVPQQIVSIKAKDIAFANPQTSADILESSGQVFIQKSQLGGGSPMIRGFSTNRLLLAVDDVRMNNAIFRGGNVQNVISIDPFSIQSTEVILGAGSVIYGSDAVGGVINFYTKKPELSISNSPNLKLNAIVRYASASQEKTGHFDFNIGRRKWAFYTSISYTDFDDLKMGKYGPDDYLRPEYVSTTNNVDTVINNEDPRIQRFTGYNQINILEKIHYQATEKFSFDLGLHYSTTSDYPRYDRLIRYRDDELRSAEWNYGPQSWFLGNFQITKLSSHSNLYDKIKFTAAYQNFQESRIDRNLYSEIRRIREENVDALSANLDFEKSITDRSKLFYGFEYIYNTVGSKGKETNINTSISELIASRYPDGSTWQSMAGYLSFKYRANKKFIFQTGVRYNHAVVKADLTENNKFYNFPFDSANVNTGAFTGTAGLSWIPNEILQWKFNLTSAFRAPNIDDVGKVFDSEPGSVVVPNTNLKPEYAYGGELGLKLNFGNVAVIDVATYYTYLDDALVRRDYSINGQTEIIYDGELSNVQAIQNASKAWIYGFEAGIDFTISEYLNLRSQYSIVGGTEEDENGMEVPVRHVAPSFGNTHLTWEKNKLKCDAFLNYNGELSFHQLAPSEAEKDYIYAKDSNGNPYAPSWYTLNFRSQYQFNNAFSIVATIENITNQRYRPYSSGIAGPGTNFIMAIKYSL